MKNKIVTELKNSFETLIIMLSSFSREELNTVPVSNNVPNEKPSWTAAQIGDHLYRSYTVLETLRGKTQPADRAINARVRELRNTFLNFTIKMEAPEFIIPAAGPFDKDTLISRLKNRTGTICRFAQKNDLSLLCLDFQLPHSGTLTRLEWLHFISVHTQRHNHQLENVFNSLKLVDDHVKLQ